MGISPIQLAIILVIVALLFGTKRLRGIGSDLGTAIKGFKQAISDEPQNKIEAQALTDSSNLILGAEKNNDLKKPIQQVKKSK